MAEARASAGVEGCGGYHVVEVNLEQAFGADAAGGDVDYGAAYALTDPEVPAAVFEDSYCALVTGHGWATGTGSPGNEAKLYGPCDVASLLDLIFS